MADRPLIFVSAGEASGDHYGAELIAALRPVVQRARFTGLGGTAMEAAGQQRTVRAEDVAVMGITEIVRHIPRIVASYRRLVRSIRANPPDVAVLIDFPDVNFRLARHLKRMRVPVIWFVSPQLWAWKRGRLRWVQQRVDKMLTIFPFEERFYCARGVDAEFVGHPLAEMALPKMTRLEFAAGALTGWNNDPERTVHIAKPWIALLPGSRWKELCANLPAMLEAAALLGPGYDFLLPVASGLDLQRVSDHVFGRMRTMTAWPRGSSLKLVRDARAALLHSRAAVVASGTATVQAAVLGTPMVVVYRVSGLTFRLAKRLVRYPLEIPAQLDEHGNLPVSMVNLIAGRRLVPELLQAQCTAAKVAAALRPLLEDTAEREAQVKGLAQVRERLLGDANRPAMMRLRDEVLSALARS